MYLFITSPRLRKARNKNRGYLSALPCVIEGWGSYEKIWSCNSSYYEIDLQPALEYNLMLPKGHICAINSNLKSVFNTYSSMYAVLSSIKFTFISKN